MAGRPVAGHQLEHRQITPRPGWVEHDADEILERVQTCVRVALREAGADAGALAAVGISNQRETTVVWSRRTGRPVAPAIVWQDTRTAAAGARLAAEGDGRGGPLPGTDRAADLDLFLGAQARRDPRGGRARPTRRGRGRRAPVRDHRHVADLAADRRRRRRRPRHRRHERLANDADGSRIPCLGARAARCRRRPGGDAARDPLLVRDLRARGGGPGRRPDRRRPRRPAGRAVRADLFRAGSAQVHLRHGLFHADAHRRAAGRLASRADHDGRGAARRRSGDVCARGLGRGRGGPHRLAARQPRDHRRRVRGRGARPVRARQRRCRVRAGLLRAVRAALAERRPWRHRRADAVRDPRAHRPRRARGDRLPGQRPRGRDGRRPRARPAGRSCASTAG